MCSKSRTEQGSIHNPFCCHRARTHNLITAVFAKASRISSKLSVTSVCFCWRRYSVWPLDGSSAIFDGVGILLYQGDMLTAISSFNKSMRQLAVKFLPITDIATSLAELLSTKQGRDMKQLVPKPATLPRKWSFFQACSELNLIIVQANWEKWDLVSTRIHQNSSQPTLPVHPCWLKSTHPY